MTGALAVVRPGPFTTVQDLGRPGLADLGVGVSGAADRGALTLANRVLANRPDAAALEVMSGGLVVRAVGSATVAVTGAAGPLWCHGRDGARRAVRRACALRLDDGDELAVDAPLAGLRTYLAVRGGLDVPPVLGSRATDVLAGLGPPVVRAGEMLPIGCLARGAPAAGGELAAAPTGGEVTLRAVPGPRADWFDAGALRALFTRPWVVTPECDRVGVRLRGPLLGRAPEHRDRELPSEGVVRGTIQVPAGGLPLVFLADHPVTGGYPVVAVLLDRDVDRAAQLRPGQSLRLRRATSLPGVAGLLDNP